MKKRDYPKRDFRHLADLPPTVKLNDEGRRRQRLERLSGRVRCVAPGILELEAPPFRAPVQKGVDLEAVFGWRHDELRDAIFGALRPRPERVRRLQGNSR